MVVVNGESMGDDGKILSVAIISAGEYKDSLFPWESRKLEQDVPCMQDFPPNGAKTGLHATFGNGNKRNKTDDVDKLDGCWCV